MRSVVNRVSIITILVNILLSIFKLITGIISKSNAMISDSIHSASDVFSTLVVMFGVHIASKEADKEHPYGHERMESIAAIILALTLFIVGVSIGAEAIKTIVNGTYNDINIPGELAILASIISIITKECMYWYTKINAEIINSDALLADAWHHRSDALSSVGALIGIVFARNGFPIMDTIASLTITLFIVKVAKDIFICAINKLVDKSCDDETEKEIYNFISSYEKVETIDKLRTRLFGNKVYVDIEIGLNSQYTLKEAHNIAEQVHKGVENKFSNIKHVMVHVNPIEA